MASLITTVSHGNYPQQPKTAYISLAAYNTVFFSYSTSLNSSYVTVGILVTVSGATALNCPAGDYLYENGKKLYPGANPGITSYMVGVYSPVSGLSGYIDPNGSTFTPMVNGKPYQIQVQTANGDYVFNTTQTTLNTTGTEDAGAPVSTNGSGSFGTYLASKVVNLAVYATGFVGTLYTTGTSCDIFMNPILGNVFSVTLPVGSPTNLSNSQNVNVYLRDPNVPGSALTSFPAGQEITLLIYNTSGATPFVALFGPLRGTSVQIQNGASNMTIYKFITNNDNLNVYQTSAPLKY